MIDEADLNEDILSNYSTSCASSRATSLTNPADLVSQRTTSRPLSRDFSVLRTFQRQTTNSRDDGFLIFRHYKPTAASSRRRRRKQSDGEGDQALVKAWLSTALVGGMRGDPFNSFPVEPRDCVPQAVDNFVQVFIPERVLRPFQSIPGIEKLAHDYFQLVISDVGMFEATVAQVEASSIVSAGARKPNKEVMLHHGRALDHLQQRLADPNRRLEDLTFHIIISIMGTHFFFSEHDQHQAHLDGLWALVNMRGGLDTLGWSGSLKQAIETVTSFVKFQTKTQTPASSPNPTEETTTSLKLDYPTHPFPTDLSATISKLPFGFSDMALARTLSVQTIDLLVDVHEQDLAQRTQQPNNSTSSPSRKRLYTADKCLQLLKSTSMPEPERMIVGGLLAYTVQSQPPASRTTFYDESLMSLLAELAQYTFFNYEHPSLLWIVMCFSVLQDHLTQGSRVDFFHHTVLRFRQSTRWSRMEKTLKEFLWTDERLREWKWAWEDAIGSHRPMGYESRTPSKSPEIEGFARDGVVTPAPSIDRYANLRPPMEVGLQIKMEE